MKAKRTGDYPRGNRITIFYKNDVTPLGLFYLIDLFKAKILSSLRDLKASMAVIIIE